MSVRYWVLLTLVCTSIPFAFAREGNGEHQLSVSGGIASPSFNSAVFQNPAGLVYNTKFRATAQAALNDPVTLNAGLLGGNGTFGVGAGLTHGFENEGHNSAFYGLGVEAKSLKLALGLAGFTDLEGGGASTTFNAGLLIGTDEKITLGLTAVGLNSSVREWGAGLSVRLEGLTALVLDSTANSEFKNFSLQPGIIVGSEKAALTLSYGFNASDTNLTIASRQLSNGFAAGGSLKVTNSVSWQLYYNQLSKWYTAVSIDL